MGKALISIGAAGLLLGVQLSAEEVPLPDAGWKAAWAFQKTCLATRGQGMDAAVAAILAQPGVKEGQNLPGYGSRAAPMRTFADDQAREYLIRPGKKGRYGCFVLLESPAQPEVSAMAQSVKAALDVTPGLRPKPSKQKKIEYYEWSIDGSKDDVRLTPNLNTDGILINLEVN